MTKPKPLPSRKIIVGNDECFQEIEIRDQATLRLISQIVDYLPVHK